MATIFSTAFPVNPSKTIDDLAMMIQNWIAGSPHRNLTREELADIAKDGFICVKGPVSLETIRIDNTQQHYGIRLVEQSRDSVRTTEVIGYRAPKEFSVAVVHDFEAHKIGVPREIAVNKPRIVNDLLAMLGGDYDGLTLRVQNKPFRVTPDDAEFVAEIINNESNNALPVIYLSKDRNNLTLLPPDRLAFTLGGMAHVVVEPSWDFSILMRQRTDGRNVFGGAIGIYWPNGRRQISLPSAVGNIETILYDRVRETALYSLLQQELRFQGLQSIQATKKLDKLKTSHQEGVEEFVTLADEELKRKDARIRELEAEVYVNKQRSETRKRRIDDSELLRSPNVAELYPGELRDMLIDALTGCLGMVQKDSRREDAIKAILAANMATGERDRIAHELHTIFNAAPRKMTLTIVNHLRSLGFEIEQCGNSHYQIFVPGNERRRYTLASTPSDNHGRKNELSGIKRYLL